mmetsp:Transcript_28877/g.62355  ORF Transcript_28877/g.62355 Transcript_28877/m.62355 type:complete len:162 (-) Transcript_28877:30-515(-)
MAEGAASPAGEELSALPSIGEAAPRRVAVALQQDSADFVFHWLLKNLTLPQDTVYLLHAADINTTPPGPKPEEIRALELDFMKFVRPYQDELRKQKLPSEALLLRGDPKHALVEATVENQIDLLVVGNRGMGAIKRALLGSVSTHCIHHCTCAVAVVRLPE